MVSCYRQGDINQGLKEEKGMAAVSLFGRMARIFALDPRSSTGYDQCRM